MATWTKKKLGDIVKINRLSAGKNFQHKIIQYADIASVGTGKIEDISTLSFENAPSRARRIVSDGDTILSTVRPNKRSFAYIKNPAPNFLVSTGLAVLTPENIDSRFLYYLVSRQEFTEYLTKNAKGATYPAVDEKIIARAEVDIPDLVTQKRIASILSVYDDLIENNEKRIKILEEMAQRLYTEWFVKFKFPGYEKVKMVDSGTEFGIIPEGWEARSISESFNFLGGGTPARVDSRYWSKGSVNWFTPTDITNSGKMFSDESAEKITEIGVKESSAKFFPAYSVMMTSRATIGAISINTVSSSTNQGFIVCIPNDRVPLYYLYFWLRSRVASFLDLASGATFKELNKSTFKAIKIILPKMPILSDFEKRVSPIGKSILSLQRQNQNLSKTRDLLMPKLFLC